MFNTKAPKLVLKTPHFTLISNVYAYIPVIIFHRQSCFGLYIKLMILEKRKKENNNIIIYWSKQPHGFPYCIGYSFISVKSMWSMMSKDLFTWKPHDCLLQYIIIFFSLQYHNFYMKSKLTLSMKYSYRDIGTFKIDKSQI